MRNEWSVSSGYRVKAVYSTQVVKLLSAAIDPTAFDRQRFRPLRSCSSGIAWKIDYCLPAEFSTFTAQSAPTSNSFNSLQMACRAQQQRLCYEGILRKIENTAMNVLMAHSKLKDLNLSHQWNQSHLCRITLLLRLASAIWNQRVGFISSVVAVWTARQEASERRASPHHWSSSWEVSTLLEISIFSLSSHPSWHSNMCARFLLVNREFFPKCHHAPSCVWQARAPLSLLFQFALPPLSTREPVLFALTMWSRQPSTANLVQLSQPPRSSKGFLQIMFQRATHRNKHTVKAYSHLALFTYPLCQLSFPPFSFRKDFSGLQFPLGLKLLWFFIFRFNASSALLL